MLTMALKRVVFTSTNAAISSGSDPGGRAPLSGASTVVAGGGPGGSAPMQNSG